MARKITAGNWKMNGLSDSLAEIDALMPQLNDTGAEALICPPATLIAPMAARAQGSALKIGGQDCHAASAGAHTGDISARMLKDAGADHVILGHSERRTDHLEDDALVAAKTQAAWQAGLTPIICLGETEAQRDAGTTLDIIGAQLAMSLPRDTEAGAMVLAYEPVWAIGTGRVPSLEQITEVHDFLRDRLTTRLGKAEGADIPLLYGGSVKPSNAAEIFSVANVDGALVGGASLKASDFAAIWSALSAS